MFSLVFTDNMVLVVVVVVDIVVAVSVVQVVVVVIVDNVVMGIDVSAWVLFKVTSILSILLNTKGHNEIKIWLLPQMRILTIFSRYIIF